jgi:hypothetical protein
MLMPVVIGRRFAGSIISGSDSQADKQYFKDPYDHPAVEEVHDKTSTNNCGGSKNNHDSYKSSKIHIILLYSFPHSSSLMMFLMFVFVPAFFTDHVEESTNTAVMKNNNQTQ